MNAECLWWRRLSLFHTHHPQLQVCGKQQHVDGDNDDISHFTENVTKQIARNYHAAISSRVKDVVWPTHGTVLRKRSERARTNRSVRLRMTYWIGELSLRELWGSVLSTLRMIRPTQLLLLLSAEHRQSTKQSTNTYARFNVCVDVWWFVCVSQRRSCVCVCVGRMCDHIRHAGGELDGDCYSRFATESRNHGNRDPTIDSRNTWIDIY